MPQTLFKPLSYELSQLLGDIDLGKLALPELQRPFVWDKTDVRDLLDSMYRGFPVGYLMLWNAAEVDARYIGTGGKQHTPTEFIIDGQQRLTSLYAVMKGAEVTFKNFATGTIRIAFRPRDAQFAVTDAPIQRDPEYLPNITELWSGEDWVVIEAFIERLREANPEALTDGKEGQLRAALGRLNALKDYPFLAVQVGHDVDEEAVAEIFLRVNSGGTSLTQADFILTLLSVFREEDRRLLEAFAATARRVPEPRSPSPYNHLISPAADQLLRVAVLVGFQRGRLQSVLALLRGGGVDDGGPLSQAARVEQFDKLAVAIEKTLDLVSWHEYLKALLASGFRRSTEISSENTLMLVYALYLIGRDSYGLSHSQLRTTIARYFFMATLTGRYISSFETTITQDVQAFTQATSGEEYLDYLRQTTEASLTSDFWSITLPRDLATSAARGPGLSVYAAALCLLGARVPPFSLPEGDGTGHKAAVAIRDLFDPVLQPKKNAVERHHLFPKNYLKTLGITETRNVNQVANLSYVEWPENLEISDTPPSEYWPMYESQFTNDDRFHHALPDGWATMSYEDFLDARRALMARVIRRGFESIGSSSVDADADEPEPPAGDTYLDPSTPFSNDLAVRRLLRGLSGNVLWYEQHMDRKALELLSDELNLEAVTELRLLSGPANVTDKTKRAFERFATELGAQGVGCDWRILATEEARQLHARVLFDDGKAFELPPLNSVLAGTVDSIRPTAMPPERFERAWAESAISLLHWEATTAV